MTPDKTPAPMPVPVALTIAGSDSSGAAGLQADLKTFHQLGVYGVCAVTLVSAQTHDALVANVPIDADLVEHQIDTAFDTFSVGAVKTGALANAANVRAVGRALTRHSGCALVVDPVAAASSGGALLDAEGLDVLRSEVIPLATLVTPNLPECEALLGRSVASDDERVDAAKELRDLGAEAVLIKDGHGGGPECRDLLVDTLGTQWLSSPRLATRATRGTGCTLSAAVAAFLAGAHPLRDAVSQAHAFVAGAITSAAAPHERGPINHWFEVASKRK